LDAASQRAGRDGRGRRASIILDVSCSFAGRTQDDSGGPSLSPDHLICIDLHGVESPPPISHSVIAHHEDAIGGFEAAIGIGRRARELSLQHGSPVEWG
jgi:hypothetical protein